MRNALVWTLTAVGLLGLLFGLSFRMAYTPSETTTELGTPDPWIAWVTQANGSSAYTINLMRLSFGLLVLGVVALGAAVRLSWRRATPPSA